MMPLFHIHGLSTIFASLAAGASVICTSGFSADHFFEWMEELRPTWYSAAPAIHQAILEAASQYPEIVRRFRAAIHPFRLRGDTPAGDRRPGARVRSPIH